MRNRNKPYTTHELFDEIDNLLHQEGMIPADLEYALFSGEENQEIRTYFWDVIFHVRFGGSEGIYLDLLLDGDIAGNGSTVCRFGTYKTLNSDDESFRIMAVLGANFALETNHWMKDKLDDFTWTGYDIDYYKAGSIRRSITSYSKLEDILQTCERRYETVYYDKIIVTEKATGRMVFEVPGLQTEDMEGMPPIQGDEIFHLR